MRPGPLRPAARVVLAQISAGEDLRANRELTAGAVRAAAEDGADLLVLPEYASAWAPHDLGARFAEPIDGPYVTALRREARASGVAVLAGVLLPAPAAQDGGPPRAANVVVAIDAGGEIAGRYQKVHLFDAFGARESDLVEAGSPDAEPLVVDVAGLRFGVVTCYDLRFPESVRRVVDAGAGAVVVPAAWADGPHKAEQWRALAVARAIESTAHVVAVGQAGPGRTGRSLVVDPQGRVVLEAGTAPELLTVDLDPVAVGQARRLVPSLAHRRYRVVPR